MLGRMNGPLGAISTCMLSKMMKVLVVLVLLVVAVSAGVVEYQARLVRSEFDAADRFLMTSMQRARFLENGPVTEFACTGSRRSKRPGKALFGVNQFVAHVIASSGELPLSRPMNRLLIGSNDCSFNPDSLEAIKNWGTFETRAKDFVQAPHWPQRLPLNDCIDTAMTDLGVVVVSHLVERNQRYEGRLDVEVFDFESQARLCSGSLSAEFPMPEGDGREHDRAVIHAYSQLIEQVLAARPES